MNTEQFLRKILPEQGHYILVTFPKGMADKPHQKVVGSIKALANAAARSDSQLIPVYHACASYASPKGVWDERQKKWRKRVVANTAFVRAQWLDIDVGPGKDYASRGEALTALRGACATLRIPAPMIVFSGVLGLHCYWVYTQDVPAQAAAPVAAAFSATLQGIGFKHDTTRTSDLASILRPVGTHNRKKDAVEVTLFRDAPPIPFEQFAARFPVEEMLTGTAPTIAGVGDDWASGTTTYAPSSAKIIVTKCLALYDVAKAKGNVPEPYWRAALGLVKHTLEGEKLCHVWSQGSPSYSVEETDEKILGWVHGPATCTQFSRHSNRCGSCPHHGKITSPISLGYSDDHPPPTVADSAEPATLRVQAAPAEDVNNHYACLIPDKTTVPFWPKGYSWNGQQMMQFVKDADGQGEWAAFSDTLYYPFLRYETEEATRALKVCALTDPVNQTWRVFDLETKAAADARTLAAALGAQEVVYMPKSKDRNMKFVQDVLHGIRAHGIETTTYNTFGWHKPGFVIGDTLLTPKGDKPVFLGSKIPEELQKGFGIAGTAPEWAQLIDHIYNRAGAEAFQFVICAAFAAPLVKLCDTDMWHGIPVGLTGPGGGGKTTTCLVACSAFGDPKKMTIQANNEGTTMNALIQRVATMSNLPLVLDEITGRETADLQAMLFALSNGKPKLRLKASGEEINPGQTWDTVTFITGNLSITRMLADSDRVKADATQVRCFEIALDEEYSSRVFAGIHAKDLIEHQLLPNQHGAAGREFLKYVNRHRAVITKELQKQRGLFAATDSTESRERFYYDLIANVLVAGSICRKIGLINFDLRALRRWALQHVIHMRSMRAHSLDTPEDYLQAFIAYLFQHTIITKYYRDGREKLPGGESIITPQREPLARHATEDRRFIVTLKAFNAWCLTQKTTPEWLRTNLEKLGYLEASSPDGVRQRICKGTGMDGVQARCLEFNYDLLDDRKLVVPSYMKVVDDAGVSAGGGE